MKFLSTLMLIFITIYSSGSHAQTINIVFKLSKELAHIKEGDLIEGTLTFWPVENVDLSQFNKLEKTVIFNAFYMQHVSVYIYI